MPLEVPRSKVTVFKKRISAVMIEFIPLCLIRQFAVIDTFF